jgi:hypothetical protein
MAAKSYLGILRDTHIQQGKPPFSCTAAAFRRDWVSAGVIHRVRVSAVVKASEHA